MHDDALFILDKLPYYDFLRVLCSFWRYLTSV